MRTLITTDLSATGWQCDCCTIVYYQSPVGSWWGDSLLTLPGPFPSFLLPHSLFATLKLFVIVITVEEGRDFCNPQPPIPRLSPAPFRMHHQALTLCFLHSCKVAPPLLYSCALVMLQCCTVVLLCLYLQLFVGRLFFLHRRLFFV